MDRETVNLRLNTRDLALVCCFAPLCTVLSFWSLFPIVGVVGKSISAAAVVAPLIGIILGPWLGAAAVALGGLVGASVAHVGPFGLLSFLPWTAAAFGSGLLYSRRWYVLTVAYAVLLLAFAFYPTIGPAWLHPYMVWLQLVGLAVLMSPLQLRATKSMRKQTSIQEVILGVGVLSFIATLFGHVVGSLMFEIAYWPTLIGDLGSWKSLWQFLTFVYPLERVIITTIVTLLGVPLIKALRAYGFRMGGD
jgi:hypothetical protein